VPGVADDVGALLLVVVDAAGARMPSQPKSALATAHADGNALPLSNSLLTNASSLSAPVESLYSLRHAISRG